MSVRPTAHPSVEVLRSYILGQPGVVPAETVAAHLAACPDCRQIVDRLAADRAKEAQPTASLPTPDPLAATRDPVPGSPSFPPLDVPPELARHPEYEVQRKLGEGGMGAVYLARNKIMDRLEVLKVLNKSSLGRDGAMDRFLQEIRSAARLQHPNVVTAHAAFRLGDLLVLAMEFVDGKDLARLVVEKGPLPVAHACYCARQVALGLQHAYEQGMVHRDIKPNNLILGRKSVVKILDFGLAKVRREEEEKGLSLTSTNVMMGTPDYMAPEQATDARRADIRADIYSLGCTLYFLLMRKPPFVARSYAEALLAHQLQVPEPVHKLRPDVPEGLAAVVARMLAKAPAARYQAPWEVARELAPFIKVEAKPAAPPAPPPLSPNPEPTILEPQPPKRGLDARLPPARPKAEVAKPPPGNGRKVALGVAVALVGLLLVLGIIVFRPFTGLSNNSEAEKVVQTQQNGTPNNTEQGKKGGEPIGIPKDEEEKKGVQEETKKGGEEVKKAARQPGEVMTVSLPAAATMKFAWIPPGTFQMGGDKDDSEKPVHRVTLTKGFYMGIYPVTQSQWQAVMNDNPSHFKGDDRPVEKVSWDDCQEFCRKMKQHTGKSMRLPTEAEWEYACRAGTTTDYYTGNGEDALHKAGWYGGNSGNQTHPVGQKAANAWGLYDMHGNVWQWCADWYGVVPYSNENQIDPKGAHFGESRVLRGGSWGNNPVHCCAAHRYGNAPALRYDHCGCRVCFRLD